MKIGFVLDDSLDTSDGVQQYILLMGSWLGKQGHEVHYLTTRTHRVDVDNLHSLGKQLRIKFNRNDVPLVLPTSPRKITEVLDRQQFDVLHVQMPYGPAFGARVVSLAPPTTAIVGTFHIAPYSLTEQALSNVLGYWLKPTTSRFDEVISVSRPAQLLARKSFGLESTIVPNMVDISSYRLSESLNSHDPARLIFIGRLVERKGCQHFIKTLAQVTEPFQATIVGAGQQRSKLEKLAVNLGLEDRVVFEGFVSEDRKRQLLANSDLAVFPATGGESFGIVLIEAMAAGSCVVLAGDNDGYASVLGSLPESLVKPQHHKDFAEIISSYIGDKRKSQELYTAQQQLVKQYDVEVVAEQVLDKYRLAIAKRLKKSHTKA